VKGLGYLKSETFIAPLVTCKLFTAVNHSNVDNQWTVKAMQTKTDKVDQYPMIIMHELDLLTLLA